MATASPASLVGSPLVHLDSSLNSPANSPLHPAIDSPCSRSASVSPTKRRKGTALRRDSALMVKDGNKEGLLVDVEQDDEGFPASLAPTSLGAHFPLSLLDKSPSLLKAHLRTPLVPLGSPITARKARRTVSQQEASPSLRVSAEEKRSFSSPTPADLQALPPPSSPLSSPAPQTLRFSPSSVPRTRTSPRKARFAPSSTETPSSSLRSAKRTPSQPLSALPKHLASFATPLQRFGAHPLSAAAGTPASPFPYSPYASPAVRPHTSYQDDELTDCDADGSLYDLDEDEDERSLSYPSVPSLEAGEEEQEVDELVEAVRPLSLTDEAVEPEADEFVEEEAGEVLAVAETSVEVITETELATSDEEVEEEEEEEVKQEEAGRVEDAEPEQVNLTSSTQQHDEAAEGESASPIEKDKPEQEADGDAHLSPATDVEENRTTEPSDLPPAPAPSSPERRGPTPPSPFLSAATPSAARLVPSVEVDGPSTPSTPIASRPVTVQAEESVPQIAETPRQQQTPQPAQRTPVAAVLPPQPAVTPPARLTTPSSRAAPSALKAPSTRPVAGAAPTAQRQLTKLSSLAAQRAAGPPPSTSGAKPALTSLIPGSAALTSRRLVAPSRSGLPKPATAVPASVIRKAPSTLSAVKEDGGDAVSLPEQPKRPSSASSTSSASSGTAPALVAQGTLPRPRTLLKSGLKPPGSATTSTAPSRIVPTSALAGRAVPPSVANPVGATAPRPTRTALTRTVPSAAPTSRLAHAASAVESSSLRPAAPSAARAPSPLLQTTSVPTLSSARAPSPALPLPTRTARTPRAALAAAAGAAPADKQAPAPLPLPLPLPNASSPVKRRAARLVGGKIELAKPALPAADIPSAAPVDLPPAIRAASPETAPPPPVPTIFEPARSSPTQQRLLSPPRPLSTRPPASPLRSPRRVLVSSQAAAPNGAASSALSAPPEKLAAATPAAEVFGTAPSAKTAPVRTVRTRRTQPATTAEPPAAAIPVRTTRRTAAAAVAPPAVPVRAVPPPTSTPVVRSARRPLRKTASDEVAAPPSSSEDPANEETQSSSASSSSGSSADLAPSLPSRPLPVFRPAPSVTQAELSRITQRNTKKNQQPFNKLKVEVVRLDFDRPPSPTSKIRRSAEALAQEGSAGRPSTKEGREARAAKRRNALRASVDGSEMAAIAAELAAAAAAGEESTAPAPPTEHFRAPGDDEQFFTPVRAPPLVGVKKAGGRKKVGGAGGVSSSPASMAGGAEEREKRRVKWDKALVYEGAREVALAKDEGILKPAGLDEWGNSTTATTSFGKAEPVLITKRIFLNDDEEDE